jgi:hypothetical protein
MYMREASIEVGDRVHTWTAGEMVLPLLGSSGTASNTTRRSHNGSVTPFRSARFSPSTPLIRFRDLVPRDGLSARLPRPMSSRTELEAEGNKRFFKDFKEAV